MTFDSFCGLACFLALNTVDIYYMYRSSNCNYFALASAGLFVFSSFFASYDAMNEYCGDRNVYRKLSTVDGNDT